MRPALPWVGARAGFFQGNRQLPGKLSGAKCIAVCFEPYAILNANTCLVTSRKTIALESDPYAIPNANTGLSTSSAKNPSA